MSGLDITGVEMEWIIIIAAIGLLLFVLAFLDIKGRHSAAGRRWEEMEGREFELFCADLLKKRGFIEVEVTKASGDYGIDILAEKEGVTYAIQCKRYNSPVGVKAVQEVYAGRDYYDRMVGVVMTNQYFTAPAVEAADRLKILLWDGGYIDSMLSETR